ncbi:MAG: hypoxanthine phosphoribosyltransferase [Clostridia bacterium]|nr:hypoxanthine phosphoribosyltransferase [Clostridia bacterium]
MQDDIAQILVSAADIRRRVKEMGRDISRDYAGKELLVVGILKGAIIFLSDLVRELSIPLQLDFMAVSSYGDDTSTSGAVRILKDLEVSVEDKHLLIVEDIVDTGLTLKYLLENLRARQPLSIRTCTLLDKPERRQVEVKVDYCGFCIPDYFVVGYGLDYSQMYRHLPDICVLKPEVYEQRRKK